MPAETLPAIVRTLIAQHLDSVLEVEILLLLYHSREQPWTADDLVRVLRINPDWAANQLAKLCEQGLLRCDAATPEAPAMRYSYQAKSAELDAAVAALDEAYTSRRVSVIEAVFAKPMDKIRSFADAFRIRRDKPDQEGHGG